MHERFQLPPLFLHSGPWIQNIHIVFLPQGHLSQLRSPDGAPAPVHLPMADIPRPAPAHVGTDGKNGLVLLPRPMVGDKVAVVHPAVAVLVLAVVLQVLVLDAGLLQQLEIPRGHLRPDAVVGAMDRHLVPVFSQDGQNILPEGNQVSCG